MLFVHGFGCDQNMWRLLAPHFATRYRVILLDLVGMGGSQLSAYDRRKYATLHGHARDMCEVLREDGGEPAISGGRVHAAAHPERHALHHRERRPLPAPERPVRERRCHGSFLAAP
ncbi:alpha/beta fold hydrolase [Ramlibacter albus]|uniref:Alpha/beta fold hydrolase n=1 Tax=Ramlibacter albus TaxID=2079448 RepID=A0A923MBM5_9BURK|nr:alpha/beta hydrolase [Ramlibacter albus]MBC5767005.1 alpha/beta fold hydrolase [Ramlibacter albus]